MATIVYALSGDGRGHLSRAQAVTQALRERGHQVVFCCGGAARCALTRRAERVIEVPGLRQVIRGNKGDFGATVLHNLKPFLFGWRLSELTEALHEVRPDLLISDLEPFAPLAATLLGVPVLSFNRQQVVTETRYFLPLRYRASAALTGAGIEFLTPSEAAHVIVPSFAFPTPKQPGRVTLVPPVVRPALQTCAATHGEHVLVYYNRGEGLERLLRVLGGVNASFIVYNVGAPSDRTYANIRFKDASAEGFMEDLLGCRGVLCSAGFNLISEALYLGKPLLVNPNRGLFEQTLNALLLERAGLGRASFHETPTHKEVAAFVADLPRMARAQRPLPLGNRRAAAVIERFLRGGEAAVARPDRRIRRVSAS